MSRRAPPAPPPDDDDGQLPLEFNPVHLDREKSAEATEDMIAGREARLQQQAAWRAEGRRIIAAFCVARRVGYRFIVDHVWEYWGKIPADPRLASAMGNLLRTFAKETGGRIKLTGRHQESLRPVSRRDLKREWEVQW